MALIHRSASSAWHGLITKGNDGATQHFSVEISDTNTLEFHVGSAIRTGAAGFTTGWYLIAATKPTGTSTARNHVYTYSSGSWAHADMSGGTIASPAAGTGLIALGAWRNSGGSENDFLDGDIEAAGVYSEELSDAQCESLVGSWSAWHRPACVGLWRLNQAAVGTQVHDLTGGGANQSAIVGTAVSTRSVPLLGYGGLPLRVLRVPAAGGGTDGTATPGVIALSTLIPSASPSTGSTTSPSAISAPVTLPAAAGSGSAAPTPATLAAPVTLPAPTTSGGSTSAPATISTPVTQPAVATTAGSTSTPAVISAPVTLPPAQATGGGAGTARPAAVDAPVTLPAAAPTAGATVTPTTTISAMTLPAVTTSSGATASPDAISTPVTLPAVTASGGTAGTATPATITTSVTLPAAAARAGSTVLASVISIVVSVWSVITSMVPPVFGRPKLAGRDPAMLHHRDDSTITGRDTGAIHGRD